MSLFNYYEKQIKKNKDIVVTVPPMQHFNQKDIFPLSGISKSLTLYCNENGYFSKYMSDRYGFNNPDNVWDFNYIDILIIGDSFAHGACVNRPYDIASLLRNKTNKNVISVAYSDNGPLIELATLREFFTTNTNIVLWFYYEGNDLEGIIKEKQNQILVKYLNNSKFTQNIKNKQSKIDMLGNELIKNKFNKKRR